MTTIRELWTYALDHSLLLLIGAATGLVWAQNGSSAGVLAWQEALDWVTTLNSGDGLCGFHDWRLPNRNELKSLVNREQVNSANWLNSQGFSNVAAGVYWSSSTLAGVNNFAWIVYTDENYDFDTVSYADKGADGVSVWPVRGGQ